MSFIGNIFGGYAARQVGLYNQRLFNLESRIQKRNAEIKLKTFQQVDKPRIIAAHNRNQSNMLVQFLRSGVDVDKIGESPFLVMLDQAIENAFDLEIAEFNSTVTYQNEINRSLLMEARGTGEAYKGELAFRTGIAKGAGDIYANRETYGSLLS
jgi:flagellar biosynthesis chaperone FliJ